MDENSYEAPSPEEIDEMPQGNDKIYDCLQLQQFDEAEIDCLKGDTVGSTVYSAKWIISTLISLSKVPESGWNDSLEKDLCMLWDMTGDKDIVDFLIDNDFFQVAQFCLNSSQEPRLEIIIGIIANMCCQKSALDNLINNEQQLTDIIFLQLSSPDTETISQTLRLLKSAVWDIQNDVNSNWKAALENYPFLGNALIFILSSSTNKELLSSTLEVLDTIATIILPIDSHLFENWFNIDELNFSLIESFNQLNLDLEDKSEIKTLNHWISILSTLVQFQIANFENECKYKIIEVLGRILSPFENKTLSFCKNTIPCIESCIEIIMCFFVQFRFVDLEVFRSVVKIMINFYLVGNEIEEHQEFLHNLRKSWITILQSLKKEELFGVGSTFDDTEKSVLLKLTGLKIDEVREDDLKKLIEALNISCSG